jgi:sterol desaturase/sphingolipid hydroxylase (fatty acid hydroxylase superfamily)
MRLSKAEYYADLIVYPPIVFALMVAVWCVPHSPYHFRAAIGILAGGAAWTLVEYVMHRLVLHHVPYVARAHDMHHDNPTAFVGTPTWTSLAAFTVGALIPLWWVAGFETAGAVTAGLMLGYCWYLVVHDAVHRWRLDQDSLLYRAKLRHMGHHFGGQEGNFGVTIGLWDRLLGTSLDRVAHFARSGRGSDVR